MQTIRPGPSPRRYGAAARRHAKVPVRCTAITSSHCSSVILWRKASRVMPAFAAEYQPAERVGGLRDRRRDALPVRDIALDPERGDAGLAGDRGGDLLCTGAVDVEQRHGQSFLRESAGDGSTDTASRPGHYGARHGEGRTQAEPSGKTGRRRTPKPASRKPVLASATCFAVSGPVLRNHRSTELQALMAARTAIAGSSTSNRPSRTPRWTISRTPRS